MNRTPFLSAALGVALLGLTLTTAVARELPDFTTLVAENGPAVVNISTQQSSTQTSSPFGRSMPDIPPDSPLYDFFQRFFGEDGEPLPDEGLQARSLGSGFIISSDGYVLTNAHVVEGADEIVVRTSERREFIAQLVGTDKRSDIALLKLNATDLPTAKIGTARALKVGEWVLAIGSPFGFEHSATAGIVSALGRSLPSENYVPFIQTDVAINPGNSGGPLFNLDGEVIGVNSQIYSRTGGFMGLSFAIPIDVAMNVVEQLQTTGRVSRGWLGVLIQDVTRELAETFGMEQPRGALVAQVLKGSPGEQAGLQAGDVILSFNGKSVPTSSSLPPLVGVSPVGKPATLEVLRQGKLREIEVVIGELPEDEEVVRAGVTPAEPPSPNRIGLVIDDLAAEEREQLGVEAGGVLVEGIESGPAERAGVRPGDVILMLDNQPIEDAKQFRELLDRLEPGRSVAALVQRGDGRMFFAIRIPRE
jgi:serine protease Do